jgi:hypothetical protein
VFHGPIRDRLALTKILLAPGGERLSPETAQWCAQLLMDSQVEQAKRKYANPRGLPEKWVENYLKRDPAQLALDVMRVYDGHFQQQRAMAWLKALVTIFGLLNVFLGTVLALLKFLK